MWHYIIRENDEIVMQSTNHQDFEGYKSELRAVQIADGIAKENRLKNYRITVFQKS